MIIENNINNYYTSYDGNKIINSSKQKWKHTTLTEKVCSFAGYNESSNKL